MRVFVVDDHPLMRDAIVMVLQRAQPDIHVVELGLLGDVSAAVAIHGVPDLLFLDLRLPDTQGVSGVQAMKAEFPSLPLIVLSASPASEMEDACLAAGADVYIEKSAGAQEISGALRLLVQGDSEPDAPSLVGKLTKRQKQLLQFLDKGLINRDIALELGISEHTVKVHLWRLFKRMDVKNRSQASHLARTTGLLADEEPAR